MSTLLEKAIIDANALKEVALKNAENLVIEKYSQEVKHAMDRLLEEEDLGLEDFGDMGMGGMGEDPTAMDPTAMDPGAELAPEEDLGDAATIDPESVARDLPDAFLAGDDDTFRIDLDQLEAEFADETDEVGVFGGDDVLDPDEVSIDIGDLENDFGSDYGNSIDFGASAGDTGGGDLASSTGADLSAAIQEALEEIILEDDDEDDEDEDDEDEDDDEDDDDSVYGESLKVDIDPQKSGWMNTPDSVMREIEDQLLAREQDDDVKEENETLRTVVSKLQKENKILVSAGLKLKKENDKYRAAFVTLQERLEQTNVSNAKLLYINKALESASLNERQKRKIVEAISRADTVNNAKVIYETFQDTVGSAIIRKKAPSSLTEAVTRKSSLLTAARHEHKQKDANPFFERMQKLAGIKD